MKIAHLILAHKGPAQLARLLDALAHPAADCFIHLDSKTDARPFALLRDRPQVRFVAARFDVHWGGYSLTEALMAASREILAHPAGYDVINVLSAQDYPLKPAAEVHEFFRRQPGQSFIACEPQGSAWWRCNRRRVERYHFTDFDFPGKYALQKVMNNLLPRRKFPLPYQLYGGATGGWFSLSRAAAEYFLNFMDAQPRLRRFVRLTWGSDEFLLPTVLLNSPLRRTIVNDNLRYIDWSGGGANPKILTCADLPALLTSPSFWARKLDLNVDAAIFDQLDEARQQLVPAQNASHYSLASLG